MIFSVARRSMLGGECYLVKKPFRRLVYWRITPTRLEDWPKNERVVEKRSFESNCEILMTIFQPRALSSDIPASRKGVYLYR